MDKKIAKEEIGRLVEKYNKVLRENRVGKYNEEMTKKDFILPLFRALGWDVEDSNEVTAEEKISKKRVDYGFRIGGIPKFFLEAKSLKIDLDNPKFFEQAVSYAWHKGCTWAVLTDFEAVKILNAEWKAANYLQSRFITIRSDEFLKRFDELWFLSKDSFEQDLLDKEAEKWGKKTKKTSIDKQLLADFTRFREMLSKNVTKLNQSKNLTEDELDESIQRILDRLIFIRNCEDRELEAKTLVSILREWKSTRTRQLIKSLRKVFAYYDRRYDSEIFAKHLCDDLEIDNEVLDKIVTGLYYTKDRFFVISYDFSAIDADVLGNIYEQYLSHILKKTEKRAKLTESKIHRKKQGIYYTPTYIVDYIVRNTLGELLKDTKIDVGEIRVLDPACGSGSFLIKAFDVLNEHYKKNDKDYNQTQLDLKMRIPFTKKVRILQDNLFGVDLDKQAVEIAKLNLLLKIAEKGKTLPLLQASIKCGNSLINNPLIAGDKALNWKEEFKEVMAEGGFTVVIGNPPYVENRMLTQEEVDFFHQNFESAGGRLNVFAIFVEQGLTLLKEGGRLGFIIHRNAIKSNYYERFRKLVLDTACIEKIVDLKEGIFEKVTGEMIIIILRKEKEKSKRNTNKTEIITDVQDLKDQFKSGKINQNFFYELSDYRFNICIKTKDIPILDKMKKNSMHLSEFAETKQGIIVGDEKRYITNSALSSKHKKVLRGRDIGRYAVHWDNNFVYYDRKVLTRAREQRIFDCDRKILTQHVSGKIIAALDEERYYALQTINLVLIKENALVDIKYLLGLLNSKLLNFYYDKYFNIGAEFTTAVSTENLDTLPIHKIDFSNVKEKRVYEQLIMQVDKMLSFNKYLIEIGDKRTDERVRIEEQMKKTDAEIDGLVYEIYGITEAEKKIIENNLK